MKQTRARLLLIVLLASPFLTARAEPPRHQPGALDSPYQLSKEARSAVQTVIAARRAARRPRDELQEFAMVLGRLEGLLNQLTQPSAQTRASMAQLSQGRDELERILLRTRDRAPQRPALQALAAPFAERCHRLFASIDALLATPDPVERSRLVSKLLFDLGRGRPDNSLFTDAPTFRTIADPDAEAESATAP